jgi:predicted outer membrane repeat protein
MDVFRSIRKAVAGLALSLFVTAETVCAATIYVDADGVADYQTISAAVEACQSGDTIIIQPGYYGGIDNTNVRIEDKVLTIRSSDPNDPTIVAATVIDCAVGEAGFNRAFNIVSTSAQTNATIAGLTMGGGTNSFAGAAVFCQQADVTLINCMIRSGYAEYWGAGLYCVDGRATVKGCTFRGNECDTLGGGAICCRNGDLNVVNCAFEDNVGSAIQTYDSNLTLTSCSFTGNSSDKGGAVYDYVSWPPTQKSLNVSGCTFVRNTARMSGGAICAENVPATITGCSFTANSSGADGGAVSPLHSSPTISSCLFIGNAATDSGGAVFNWHQSSPQIINCTFVANTANAGGAVASRWDSAPFIYQCILWNNAARTGKNIYVGRYEAGVVYVSKTTVQYSDVEGGQSSAAVESGCTLTWSLGNLDADPIFIGPFQDDFHLSPDSPCIDAGDPAFAPPADAEDMDGYPRRFGNAVDMGAFEYQGLGPVYRFWSSSLGAHFYTISGSERDKLIRQYSQVWQLEGIAYYAYFKKSETNLTPIYRFWSASLKSHVWTAKEDEKNKLLAQPSAWQYEGIAFYAYPAGKQPFGSVPVYRFWSGKLGSHFYTADEKEKHKLELNYAHVWTYEGIAWYAFAQPNHLAPASYEFTGGSNAASYTMTLEASIDGVKAEIDRPLLTFVSRRTDAQMTIDFVNLKTTLDDLHVQTETLQVTTILKQQNLTMPVTFSISASFDGLSPRGPYSIEPNDVDPSTSLFANFLKSPKNLDAAQETFTCSGSATMAGQVVRFTRSAAALRFELESTGIFESIKSLPEGLSARMPLTFQWHRSPVRDLLVEASAGGHLVRIYVTSMYVGTLDLWEGHVIK